MADSIPQYKDTQPIINPQPIESEAEGYQAFSDMLGKLSQQSIEEAGRIGDAESKSMYINSAANIEQLKTSAQINILSDPNNASRISSDMDSSLDMIKQSAYVNKEDRARLNAYASTASDDVALKAAETNVKQTELTAAFTHYQNFLPQLKAYLGSVTSGNQQQADHLQQAMMDNLKNLVEIRAITPYEAFSSIKLMQTMVDASGDVHQLASIIHNGGSVTAQQYHTVASNPVNGNQTSNAGAPIDGSTQYLTDHYVNDKTFQGALAAVHNDQMPDVQALVKFNPNQRNELILRAQGGQVANGIINSGQPLPKIESIYNTLNAKGNLLNYRDQETRIHLENWLSDLKNGNYLSLVGKSPDGGAFMQDWVNKNAAIQTSNISDTQKLQQMDLNKNNMVNKAVAWGDARHIPSEDIKPIPTPDLSLMQNGFKLNQDPSSILTVMKGYTKPNQAYIANSLKDPTQRLIAMTLSYAGNNVEPSKKLDFIAANQQGRSFADIKPEQNGVKDAQLNARIVANLKSPLTLIGQTFNKMDANTYQTSMIASTLNYAKYLASTNNDFSLQNWSKWVDQACDIYSKSYIPISSSNYAVNGQQLPQPLSKPELDMIAKYAIDQGYHQANGGQPDYIFNSQKSANPLTMRISPTNHIQAVDQNGTVYYDQPFDSNLMASALKASKDLTVQNRKDREQAFQNTVSAPFKGGLR